ncbi:MAG: TetR/AcrR family transcriptional regulator [Deltaproteobacteria bacterium]|nr:TetR/AcrR family transcriptional regulator [Deltaproteobacteria bacterium]
MKVLAEEGDSGLTIEALCTRLEKTKGSFYHHFPGREGFVARLLEHWESVYTGSIIDDLEPLGDPRKRLLGLAARTVREVDSRLERAIRIWSDRNSTVKVVLTRVDQVRESYMRDQFAAATQDSDQSAAAARAHLAILVGTQMLYQHLSRDELSRIYSFVDFLGLAPAVEATELAEMDDSEEVS